MKKFLSDWWFWIAFVLVIFLIFLAFAFWMVDDDRENPREGAIRLDDQMELLEYEVGELTYRCFLFNGFREGGIWCERLG
jgi:hypothetical protein